VPGVFLIAQKSNSVHNKLVVVACLLPNHQRTMNVVAVPQVAVAQNMGLGAVVSILNQAVFAVL
jgi:hypothetical protein